MKDTLIIDGKEFISSRRAAEMTKYTNDYVGQLCRQSKVVAKRFGRVWFIDRDSILQYKKNQDNLLGISNFDVRVDDAPILKTVEPDNSLLDTSHQSKLSDQNNKPQIKSQSDIVWDFKHFEDVSQIKDSNTKKELETALVNIKGRANRAIETFGKSLPTILVAILLSAGSVFSAYSFSYPDQVNDFIEKNRSRTSIIVSQYSAIKNQFNVNEGQTANIIDSSISDVKDFGVSAYIGFRDFIVSIFGTKIKTNNNQFVNTQIYTTPNTPPITTIINLSKKSSSQTSGITNQSFNYYDTGSYSYLNQKIDSLREDFNKSLWFEKEQNYRIVESVSKTSLNSSSNNQTQVTDLSQLTGTLGIGHGGTGVASLLSGLIYSDGTSALNSTTSPLVGSIFASSTIANNIFLGNVGVGTTSPLSKLDVYGDLILSGLSRYVNFGDVSGSSGYGIRDNGGIIEFKNTGGTWLGIGSGGGGGSDGNWSYFNGSGIRLATSSNTVLVGANSTTTSSKLEVIGSGYYSGNLGIGTTSPWRTLSVKGNSDLGNNALAGSFTATSTTASVFPYASSTAVTVSGNLYLNSYNGPLQANNGIVSATTSIGVVYGGTGVSTFGQGWIYSSGGTTALAASTSPTVNYLVSTSTTATSTFAGPISIIGSSGLNVLTNGHVGIGTSTPVGSLYVPDLVTQAIAFPSGANITYQSGYNAYTNFSSGIGIASVPFATVNIDTPNKVALSNISTIQSGELNVRSGGTFGTKTDYTTGTLPSGIYVSDINNDGKKDVITGNNGSDNISVFPGNGDGTLGSRTNYSTGTGSGPAFVTAADLNGDGFNDIVAADNASTTMSVFINKKDGTFLAHVDYISGTTPGGITINDFNGDGKSDIAVSNYGSNTISVFINNGDGTFASKVNYTVGSAPTYITSADVNGDGKIDIISPNFSSNTVSVLMNNGNGTFATKVDYVTAAGPQTSDVGDVNGDGKPDIVVGNYTGNSASVFLNNGNGTFAAKVDYTLGINPVDLHLADFSGDGKPDIAVVNYTDSTVSVLINNGDGTFASKVDYSTNTGPSAVAIGDLNRDGAPDIVVADTDINKVSVLLNQTSSLLYAQASTNRVAIGTSTPYSKFSVWGTGTGTNRLFDLVNSASTTIASFLENGTGYLLGNIGVGTTSPYSKLAITNSSASQPALSIYGFNSQTSPLMLVASTTGSATSTAFIIDNNGKVGVGTSSPYVQLSVAGIGAFDSLNINSNATSTFVGGIQAKALNIISTTASSTFGNGISLSNGCYAINGTCIGAGTIDGAGLANKLAFWSGASTISYNNNLSWLNSSSRFGIGTSTPNWDLQVASSSGATIALTDTSASANTKHWTLSSLGGNFYLSTSSDSLSASSNYMWFDTNNYGTYLGKDAGRFNSIVPDYAQYNTFVGYASGHGPSSWISDNNTGVGALSLYSATTGYDNTAIGYMALYNNVDGDQNIVIGSNTGTNIVNGSRNIIIGSNIDAPSDNGSLLNIGNIIYGNNIDGSLSTISSGNIGIGTTSPGARFSISGASGGSVPLFAISSSTAGFATSTSLIVDANGKVGIGTTTPYTQLSVAGNIAATGLTLSGITGSTQCLRVNASGIVSGTGADCGTSSGASYDWLQQTNTFGVNSLTPTTTIPIWIKSTATSTFAGGIESWDKIGAPYFNATSSTATSTFNGGLIAANVGNSYGLYALSSTGYVGIGTNSPFYPLSVITNADNLGLQIRRNSGSTNTTNEIGFRVASTEGSNLAGIRSTRVDAGAGHSLSFFTNPSGNTPTIRMTLASTGEVGVGSTTPWARLSVNGSNGGTTPLFVVASSTSAYATSTVFMIDQNGQVGIGSSSPMSVFGIVSPYKANVSFGNGTVTGYTGIDNVDSAIDLGTYSAHPVRLETSGVERLRVLSTGNIGVGTTSPWTNFAISGSAAQSTPIFAISTSTAGFATSTAFIIDSNGKVGIGTTTPYTQLSVAGNIAATGLTLSGITGSTQCLRVDASGIVSGTGADCGTSSGAAYDWLQQSNTFSVNSLTPTTTIPIWIKSTATSTFAGGIESWDKIGAPYFNATSSTATSTFNGGLRVGTGVNGLFAFQNGFVSVGTSSTNAVFSIHSNTSSQAPLFMIASSTNGAATTTAFFVAANGTIGVGTAPVAGFQMNITGASRAGQVFATSQMSSPNYLLTNPGTVNSYASMNGGIYSTTNGGIYPFNNTMNLIISPQTGGGTPRDIVFAVGSTTVSTVVIRGSSYNVGIGTTSPYAKLSVIGSTAATTTFAVYGFNSQTAPLVLVASTTGSATSTAFIIDNNGQAGIGTSTPWRTLSLTGTAAMPGLTVAGASGSAVCLAAGGELQVNSGAQTCTVSSAKFKHDIESQISGLDTIRALRPVSFKYNNDSSGSERLGLIAEEVNKVDPRLIFTGNDNEPRGVRYEDLTSVLTRAVQELDTKVDDNASTTLDFMKSSKLSVDSSLNKFTEYDNQFTDITKQISEMNIRISDIASSTSTIASTTIDAISHDQSFIEVIANKVKEYIASAGEWVVSKISSVLAVFDRVETKTAAVSNGIEMTDSSTKEVWCVRIQNGDWNKLRGKCGDVTSEIKPEVTPVLNNINIINTETATTTIVTNPDNASTTPVSSSTSTDETTNQVNQINTNESTTTQNTTPTTQKDESASSNKTENQAPVTTPQPVENVTTAKTETVTTPDPSTASSGTVSGGSNTETVNSSGSTSSLSGSVSSDSGSVNP